VGAFKLLNVQISSRVLSEGYDISTPVGDFSAKKVIFSFTDKFLISDSSGNQIARLGVKSFFSRVYYIVFSGGGFYQFDRDAKAKRTWTCEGEGRLLSLSERSKRRFFISDGSQDIAEGTKTWYARDYAIKVANDSDLRLVVCIFIALSVREYQQSSNMPIS
jgi:uncharacterized protein YxjI